jgi:proteic killer suppression protein
MRIYTLYTVAMIKSFAHKGLEKFFKTGSKAGIQAAHENRLRVQLAKLESAKSPQDMDLPAWRLHPLKGTLKGHWSVSVSGNWRLTFRFAGEDAEVVDYQDYH